MLLRKKGWQIPSWEWMGGRAELPGNDSSRVKCRQPGEFHPRSMTRSQGLTHIKGAPSAGDCPGTSQAFDEEASLSSVTQPLNTRQRHFRLSDFHLCVLRVTPLSWVGFETVPWGRALKRSPQSSLLLPVSNHPNVQNKDVFYSVPQLISSHVGNEWFSLSLEIGHFGNVCATQM